MKEITLESYTVCKNGFCPPMRKSPAIAGMEGNHMFPLVYLTKPKNISEESFKAILDGLRLEIPPGFVIARESTQ